ncbi:hypothetical protein QQP08_004438 [Theobroma cacao]|nr:hypothetical protein QQP08_004438 [Theobroma cacao]
MFKHVNLNQQTKQLIMLQNIFLCDCESRQNCHVVHWLSFSCSPSRHKYDSFSREGEGRHKKKNPFLLTQPSLKIHELCSSLNTTTTTTSIPKDSLEQFILSIP